MTKYGDKKNSLELNILSLVGVTIMIFLSTFYEGFLIFFAIFIAVLIAGKLDSFHYQMAGAIYGVFSLYKILESGFPFISIPIIISAFIDEIGNDLADKKRLKFLNKFFEKRLTMDIFCFILALFSVIPWLSLLLILCFDAGYQLETKLRL